LTKEAIQHSSLGKVKIIIAGSSPSKRNEESGAAKGKRSRANFKIILFVL
jgi:hypothetical protein